MTAAEIVGWAGALTAISIGIPQVVRLIRTRSTAGVSLVTWQAVLALNIGWGVHGLLLDALNMVVSNAFSVIASLMVLGLIRRERHRGPLSLLMPSGMIAAVMIAVDLALGSTWFGAVAVVVSLVANAGQGISLVRSVSIAGVAPGFLVAQLLNQLLWLAWALLVADSGTLISSASTGLVASFNLVWWLLRRFGMPAIFVRPATGQVVATEPAGVSSEA